MPYLLKNGSNVLHKRKKLQINQDLFVVKADSVKYKKEYLNLLQNKSAKFDIKNQ